MVDQIGGEQHGCLARKRQMGRWEFYGAIFAGLTAVGTLAAAGPMILQYRSAAGSEARAVVVDNARTKELAVSAAPEIELVQVKTSVIDLQSSRDNQAKEIAALQAARAATDAKLDGINSNVNSIQTDVKTILREMPRSK